MANLTARHPFDELFRDLAPGYYFKPLHGDPLPAQFKIDVKEVSDSYTVLAELPGVAREDIHVMIDGGMLTVRAEIKQHDSQQSDERVLRSERYYGSVSRSVQLPHEIDEEKASAKYEDGVLVLTLPKKRATPGGQRLRID